MFKQLWEINPNKSTIIGWIDPLIKTNSKPFLVNFNLDPSKPLILDENKVLIKPKQAWSCSW
jgi:hypothetical protein